MNGSRQIRGIPAILLLALLLLGLSPQAAHALTVVNQGAGAVNNYPPNNVVSVAVTTTITRGTTISWGLQGGSGSLNLGTITIPANQTVGFGSGAIPAGATPGQYSVFALEQGQTAQGGQVTVQGPPPQPTQPPVLTTVEDVAINTIVGVYVTRKTEVKVLGTCQYAGETIEVLIDGNLVSSVYSTGTNWGATVTIPNDGNPHAVSARNAAGASTSVNVRVDTQRPTFRITTVPSSPFAVTPADNPIRIRIDADEPVRGVNLTIVMNGGTPAPITVAAVGPTPPENASQVWEGTMAITNANGNPSIGGLTGLNGAARFVVSGYDVAKPDPGNLGNVISQGENVIIQVAGPSAAGAKVIVEGNAIYTNRRTLNFTWEGFTHSLGDAQIQSYWYRAFPAGTAPGAAADTQGWTNYPAVANPTAPYAASLQWDQDGTVAVHVKAVDRNNNFSGTVFDEIIVDTTGPVASNPFPANGANVTDPQTTISVRLVDPAPGSGVKRDTIVLVVNGISYGVSGSGNPYDSPGLTYGPSTDPAAGGAFVLNFNPKVLGITFPRGAVTCSVAETTVDNIGNRLGATAAGAGVAFSWTFNVDTNVEAPIARNPIPQNVFVNSKRPVIRLNLEDPDLIDRASVRLEINGVTYDLTNSQMSLTDGAGGAAGSVSVLLFTPVADFADGTISCRLAQAKDRVGNSATPFSWNFSVDTTGPLAQNPSPGNGIVVESAAQIVTVEVVDELSGVNPGSFEVRVRYQPTFSTTPSFDQTYTTPNAGLVYNPSTQLLSFNPAAASPVAPFGQGSITITLLRAQDRAVTIDAAGVTTPAPNNLRNAPYQWTFFIGSNVGPIVSDIRPVSPPISTMEPLVVSFTLADPDFIDHSSLIFDFNGRTYRDGDLGVAWTTGTSAVLAGTHEVVQFSPPNAAEIVQGTNELRIRAARDRRGNALQQSPVTHLFAYDTEGPKVTGSEPASTLYDRRQRVFFTLNDNYSGVAPETITLRITASGGGSYDFGTTTSPANLLYNSQTGRVTFQPNFDYQGGQTYTFRVTTATRDRAGNALGKTIGGGPNGTDHTFSLRMASSTEVVILERPANNSYQNTTALDDATREPKFHFKWRGPSSGLPTGGGYELVIADNFAFSDESPNRVWKFGTTATTFRHDTLSVILQHGNQYYWYVNAVTQVSGETVPEDAERYARSSLWTFTVDNLPPVQPDIRAVIDFRNIEPDNVNSRPYSTVTYVKNTAIRVRTYCYEEALATEGYILQIYNKVDHGPQFTSEYLLGTLNKTICAATQEIDITLPNKDGLYHLIARIQDRAGNYSLSTGIAQVHLDRTLPKVESVIITDKSPNTNGYITSGQSKIEIVFNDAIDLLPLEEYRVMPSIKFDPAGSGRGTAPVEVTNLAVKGRSISGLITVPFGDSAFWDGMADILVVGVMDKAYNEMDGGYYFEAKVFEIDTAPKFEVQTFLNPVDEKNVLLNIYASETLLQAPTLWITTNNGIPNNVPVNIMARNLFAATYDATVGQNMIRVSGPDAKGNIGYFPIYENLKESTFLVYSIARDAPTRMSSADMGIAIDAPAGAVAQDTRLYVFPTTAERAPLERLALSPARMAQARADRSASPSLPVEELVQAGILYNLSPGRLQFGKPVRVTIDVADVPAERLAKVGLYASLDGETFEFVGGGVRDGKLTAEVNGACVIGAFVDETAPRIEILSPANGVLTPGERKIRATLIDRGAGIDPAALRLALDGKPCRAAYDRATGELSFDLPDSVGAGEHSFEIEVRDRVANIARSGAVPFTVPKTPAGIAKAIAWPNPARTVSTVSFTAAGIAAADPVELTVKVYDAGGRMVRELIPAGPLPGGEYRAAWDLANGRGRAVANGTYMYKITLVSGNRRETATGKIAVLR